MSQSRNKNNKYFFRFFLYVLGIILVWFTFSWLKKFYLAKLPVYGDVVSLALDSKQALIKKVISLQGTIAEQHASISELETLQKENENLKAQFGRNIDNNHGILARTIVPPSRSIYDTVIIDAGTEEGIEVDQRVYAFGSVAIGTISNVEPHTSTVLLYSSPNRQTVGTATGNNIAVTLIGRGSGEYEVRMPRDVAFEQGGVISEQSLEVHTLATIEKIITDPRDPFQRLLAKAPVNLQTLKWVIVK